MSDGVIVVITITITIKGIYVKCAITKFQMLCLFQLKL